MSWKEDVEESVWYTEASKRCFPEALSLCSLRSVENKPVEERKSGTAQPLASRPLTLGIAVNHTAGGDGDSCPGNDDNLSSFSQNL